MEERRKQQEQEEIARARLEEQRRLEREAQEAEEQDDSDSIDDEFEAKVRTKEIRRINPNLLVQFMSENKEEVPITRRPKKETIENHQVLVTETAPMDENNLKDSRDKDVVDEDDDEFELKVKKGQVSKLILGNSPFLQQQKKEDVPVARKRSDAEKNSKESKKDSRTPVVQEDVPVRVVHDEVVESQPDMIFSAGEEDEGYEVKIKSKDVRKLSHNQFLFLRQQEEEERKRLQEEERRRIEREERELRKKEEERRRRLEAEARAREEERIRREEETRKREEEERARKEEEKRRRLEEAERLRREEEERLQKEEEEELMRLEEMRRQKQAAKLKFESGSFDGVSVSRTENDIYSVGRLNTNKLLQFQQGPREEPKLKSKPRVEQKKKDEYKSPEPEVETVQMASVDLIESSPYEGDIKRLPTEDEVYEEKRKSVGKLDREWYIKQQQRQAEENERRAKELEEQRLIKSKDVRKLSHNQFLFLRQQEEEERKRLQEEERRRIEREERELRKKEEERRRRLEAEARAREEERIRREEETRKREEEERARKEEEKRRRLEEAERLRREEEERLQKEEEEELMRLEEMRRQKQAAKLKFESGSFDGVSVSRTENDIYSVGRLNTNKLLQFQQGPREEPKLKSKPRVEQKKKDEYKSPEPEVETVQMASVDLIESSPYEGDIKRLPTEDEVYEEKRKSVGKLDREWYIKQQQRQAEENERRAKELEEQRLREERNEMLRIKGESSQRRENDDSRGSLVKQESLNVDTDEVESEEHKNVGRLNYQQFSMFQKDGSVVPKAQPRKKAPEVVQEVVGFRSQEDVESAPVNMDESDAYHGGLPVTQEDFDYEKRINTGKRLDVDRFLNVRSQEAAQRTERAKRMAEERKRQEEEELAKLRFEERRRMDEEVDSDYVESGRSQASDFRRKSGSSTESDPERPRRILIETEPSRPKESDTETERMDKGVSVGRLPQELRSQFEGGKTKTDADSRRKSSKSKGSRSSSRNSMESPHSTSNDSVSDVPHDQGMNGGISPKDKSLEMEYSVNR